MTSAAPPERVASFEAIPEQAAPWSVLVDDPRGWVAIVSRTLPVTEVQRAVASGILESSRRMPMTPPRYASIHSHGWQAEGLEAWALEEAAKDGPPAMLRWWPVLEQEMRAPEWLWPSDAGGDRPLEHRIQHALDRKGPWAGPFDTIFEGVVYENWGHYCGIEQIGRGDGRKLPGQRHRCAGKGMTAEIARLSAVCESVERRCVTQPSLTRLPTRWCAAKELPATVDVPSLVAFTDRQWETLDRSIPYAYFQLPRHRLPKDWRSVEMAWVPGTHLDGDVVWVPKDFVFYEMGVWAHWLVPDTNGASAGADVEDAFQRGFCEVLERAAVACWWTWRIQRPQIDFDSLPDTTEGRWCRRGKAVVELHGRHVHLLDLTLDERLPVVVAVAWKAGGTPDPAYGMGCARTVAGAAVRALGEIVQHGVLQGFPSMHAGCPEIEDLATMPQDELAWLFPKGTSTHRDVEADAPERAVAKALFGETVVVDVTQRDDEPAVVKVVCPAAPHFWHRLGCEKLYTLPVEHGWLDTRPVEADANPLYIGT